MTTYQTNDGETFDAADAADLVSQMRDAAFIKGDDVADYIAKIAASVADQTGSAIAATSAEDLVEDLIKIGFLKVLKNEDDD